MKKYYIPVLALLAQSPALKAGDCVIDTTRIIGKTIPVGVFENIGIIDSTYVGMGYAATSVNTPVFRCNSITSNDSLQFCAYYNPEGEVMIARRTLPDGIWVNYPTGLFGDVSDAHKSISVILDRNMTLHLSYNHHGDQLRYFTAVDFPGGKFKPATMIGRDEGDVTYPEFHELPDGRIIFAYRAGHSGGGNLIMNVYDPATGIWSRLHDNLVDGEGERNAYWQLYVDPDGAIHLSWVWRETWFVETNHDMCYAVSHDGGLSWQRSDGTYYQLPITAATAEIAWPIPQGSELINQTSMTCDTHGNPAIATYWREKNDSIPQYRLIHHDGNKWHSTIISKRTSPFSLSGGGTKMIPIARPRIAPWLDGFIVLTRDLAVGGQAEAYILSPSVPDTILQYQSYNISKLVLSNDNMQAWEPTIDSQRLTREGVLDIFIQSTTQGDGEKTTKAPPSPIYILHLAPAPKLSINN